MHSEAIYNEFKAKVFNLNSSAGSGISDSSFVRLFNEQLRKWVQNTQAEQGNNYRIENLDPLLITGELLTVARNFNHLTSYRLPEKFFLRVNVQAEATKEGGTSYLYVQMPKPKDFDGFFHNDFYKPSYEFEHTLGRIAGKHLVIYKSNDFELRNVYFSYYRLPEYIDLAGYIKEDGSVSVYAETDLPDYIIDQVIDMAVLEYFMRANNTEAAKMAAERISFSK